MKKKLSLGFIRKKVPSATVIEMTVAMVLAGICFVLAIMVFGQVTAIRFNDRDLEVELAVENIIALTVQENRFTNETISKEEWVLQKHVSNYKGHTNLLLLSVLVTDLNGKELLARQQLLYVKNE